MAPSGGDPPLEGGPAVAAADEYLSMTDYFIIERKTLFDSTCNDSGFHFIAVISAQFVPVKNVCMGFAFGSYSQLRTRDAHARPAAGASNIHLSCRLWSNKNIMISVYSLSGIDGVWVRRAGCAS